LHIQTCNRINAVYKWKKSARRLFKGLRLKKGLK